MSAPVPAADGPPRPVRAGLVAIVILPIVTAVVRALRHHWFPVGDAALLYIRVRDTFTGNHPLLGSWTSASLSLGVDVNNPGATYDHLIGPFAHVLSPGPGAAIAVGFANALAIVGISSAARHIGGWSLQRWALLGCAALAWTMGSELLFDLWQPHSLLFPFLAYLVLLVGVSIGRTRCVPWTVFVASLLVQTHIGYAYIVAAMTPAAIAIVWWQHRPVSRSSMVAGLRSRTAVISALVFVAVWAQSFVEQLFGEGRGNLMRLATASGGGDVTLGLSKAAKIVAGVVLLPPWWLRSGFSSTVPNTRLTDTKDGPELIVPGLPGAAVTVLALVAGLAALVLLGRACARAGLRTQANAVWLAAIGIVIGVVSLTILTIGPVGLAAHHARWLWAFALFVHAVTAWAVVSWALARRQPDREASAELARRRGRLVDAVVVVLLLAFTALDLPAFAQQQGPVVDAKAMTALRRVFPHLGVLAAHQPVLFDITNLRVFEPYSTAVMMELQDLDIEFRVADEPMVRQLGNGRRADGTEPATIFQLEGTAALLYDGPACRLAIADALDPEVAQRAAVAAKALAVGLVDGSLYVDPSGLTTDEQRLLDSALGGDLVAASRAVDDGLVAGWLSANVAALDPDLAATVIETTGDAADGTVAGALELIGRRVASTYGVYATPATACTP